MSRPSKGGPGGRLRGVRALVRDLRGRSSRRCWRASAGTVWMSWMRCGRGTGPATSSGSTPQTVSTSCRSSTHQPTRSTGWRCGQTAPITGSRTARWWRSDPPSWPRASIGRNSRRRPGRHLRARPTAPRGGRGMGSTVCGEPFTPRAQPAVSAVGRPSRADHALPTGRSARDNARRRRSQAGRPGQRSPTRPPG